VAGEQLVAPPASMVAWAAFGILVLIIISAVDAKIGGWLLLLIVVGMVYSAHTRGLL
jgi:hypothetical protein